MKKYYLKNGKEVQLGDVISKIVKVNNPLIGKGDLTTTILITETNLPLLLKKKILSTNPKSTDKLKESEKVSLDMNIGYYVDKLAQRLGWRGEKMSNYLNTLHSIYPATAFSLLLREIAIELDKKYKDHIENSPEIYVVSMLDGRITRANKAHIKNYRNFAAFRSIDDAKVACSILKEILKDLFKSGK